MAVLLVAASIGLWLAHAVRVPAIPVVLVVGMASSALVPIPGAFLEEVLILGVTVVLFVAGIELDPSRVGRYRRSAIRVGLLQFFTLGTVGLGVGILVGFSLQASAYVGLAISASSTVVVIRILQQRFELYTPMGRTVTGILLMQDLLVVLLIPVVVGLSDGPAATAEGVARTLGMVAFAGAVLRWITPRLIPYVARDEEFLLLTVLGVLFLFVGLGHLVGVPLVSAAFLAGLALSPFPVNVLVRGQVKSLGQFFSAIFFAALGASLTLPSANGFLQALLFSFILVLLTPPIVALVSERNGLSARAGIGAGLLLAQASEFSLVVGLQAVLLGQFSDEVFSVIALVTMITMILTPVLATARVAGVLIRIHPFNSPDVRGAAPEGHVLIVGCGSSGTRLLEFLVGVASDIWVVDDDPVVVDRIGRAGFAVLRGDATDVEVLDSAGAHQARLVISTLRHRRDSAALLAIAGDVPVLVRTFDDGDDEWIEERGGIAVSYSEAGTDGFLEWLLEETSRGTGAGTVGA
ncbi:MAG: cation:proton antiporter [Gemmatimonadota bacterium]